MEDSQVEHVGMFVKVKTFLIKKATSLSITPIVGSSLQPQLIGMIDSILTEEEDASAPIAGSTELKRNLRTSVQNKGFTVGAACAAYYTVTVPNPVLRVKCEFVQSDFDRMRDNDVVVAMQRVHAIADPVKTALVSFGVADTDVDALGIAIADYFAQMEAPYDARGERAASGKQVDRLINQTLDFLKDQLDVVMKYYAVNNPELHDYYLNARAIDNTGGGPIPDEDEEITIGSGAYYNGAVTPETNADSRIVIINRTSNHSLVQAGFSTTADSFSGTHKDVSPNTTNDDKAVDMGFTLSTGYFVFHNPGTPTPESIVIRVKGFY